jgi:DNA-binding LacI/PurR family transcriptional regulator
MQFHGKNTIVFCIDATLILYTERSSHDLVSIDHRCAGYLVAEHFLKLGCRRIAFVAYRNAAQSTKSRVAGYQEALLRAGVAFEPSLLQAAKLPQRVNSWFLWKRLRR